MKRTILIAGLACAGFAACDSRDETLTMPQPCQSGTAVPECLPDASDPDDEPDGGGPDVGDAALDAEAPDSTPPDATPADAGVCVEAFEGGFYGQCPTGAACETLDTAVDYLRGLGVPLIVRRECQAEDGTQMVSIGHVVGLSSRAFIYEASTGALVAVQVISDYSEFCNQRSITAFSREPRASSGALVLDCGYQPPSEEYGQCTETDAGSVVIRWDGGTPEECIFGA